MTRCSTCGASLGNGAVFCASCGAPQARAAPWRPPPPAEVPGPQSMAEIPNVAGALAYLLGFISGLYFFWNERYQQNPFVRFHAFQSIFLSAVAIVVFVALN